MVYDVAIIGAGPCGLAVAARLRESTPAALFTDDEHARYWKRFNRSESIENERRNARRSSASTNAPSTHDHASRSIVVLDAKSSEWMSAWRERFHGLQIEQLRSPLFFHPDPRDRDGLLAFSHFEQRSDELEEIQHVVGKEISKHRAKKSREKKVTRHLRIDDRDRIDYFTPSSALFDDYCDDIVHRYHLQDLVQHAQVEDIAYGVVGDLSRTELFSVTTDKGLFLAKTVVLAVGPGSKPSIPRDCHLRLGSQGGSVCHCFNTTGSSYLPDHVLRKIAKGLPTNVIVVGGGLTSAQISDMLVRQGVNKVWLLLRGKYKLKHFDVDLEWVSKLRNHQMAVFWSAETDEERFELLRDARNGGSITPKFDKILQKHVARKKLTILPHTEIETGSWNTSTQSWSIGLSADTTDFPKHVDHIIYATGNGPNCENVACLRQILNQYPLQSINGLARITDDLMWNHEIPLFLTGGLAGLRLGPGAANLAGARQGAERIAWKIDELLGRVETSKDSRRSSVESEDDKYRSRESGRSEFTGGFVNQFEALDWSSE